MWYAFAVLFALALVVLLAVQVHRVYVGYQKATGTKWQRFLSAFSDSLTILWARLLTIVGAVSAFVVNFLPALDPSTTLGQSVQAVLKPEYVPFYALGIGILFEVMRRRPGSVDPILPPTQAK